MASALGVLSDRVLIKGISTLAPVAKRDFLPPPLVYWQDTVDLNHPLTAMT